jgi:hypothetical protein
MHPLASLLQRWTKSCFKALKSGTANHSASHVAIPDVATKPSSLHAAAPASWPATCVASSHLAGLVRGIL